MKKMRKSKLKLRTNKQNKLRKRKLNRIGIKMISLKKKQSAHTQRRGIKIMKQRNLTRKVIRIQNMREIRKG